MLATTDFQGLIDLHSHSKSRKKRPKHASFDDNDNSPDELSVPVLKPPKNRVETERKRRESLSQLFDSLKDELIKAGSRNSFENRNSVLQEAIATLQGVSQKGAASTTTAFSPSNELQNTIATTPGLKQLIEHLESMKKEITDLKVNSCPTKIEHPSSNPQMPETRYQPNTDYVPASDHMLHEEHFKAFLFDPQLSQSVGSEYTSSPLSPTSSPTSHASISPPQNLLYDVEEIPRQSTAVVDISRMLLGVFLMVGVGFAMIPGVTETDSDFGTGRTLNEFDEGRTSFALPSASTLANLGMAMLERLLYFVWWFWGDNIFILFTVVLFLLMYTGVAIMTEPFLSEGSLYYKQACIESHKALQCVESNQQRQKHTLRALSYLGKKVPSSGLHFIANLTWQFTRFIMHFLYIGLWIEKLVMKLCGGPQPLSRSLELFLDLLRQCFSTGGEPIVQYNSRSTDSQPSTHTDEPEDQQIAKGPGWLTLLYMMLNIVNTAHLVGHGKMAEAYAHLWFFVGLMFPNLGWLASLYFQLAWKIAQKRGDQGLVFLLFSTGHYKLRQGQWEEAEAYISRAMKYKNTLPAQEADLFSNYCLLMLAVVSLARGNLEEALIILNELKKECKSTQTHQFGSLAESYVHYMMGNYSQAESTLLDQPHPTGPHQTYSGGYSIDWTSEIELGKLSMISLLSFNQKNYQQALQSSELAYNKLVECRKTIPFVWSHVLSFIDVLLSIWEKLLEAPAEICCIDGTVDGKTAQMIAKRLAHKIRHSVSILESHLKATPALKPVTMLYKGRLLFCLGKHEEACRLWNKALKKAKKLDMHFEEGVALYEMGRHIKLQPLELFIHTTSPANKDSSEPVNGHGQSGNSTESEQSLKEELLKSACDIFTKMNARHVLKQAQSEQAGVAGADNSHNKKDYEYLSSAL